MPATYVWLGTCSATLCKMLRLVHPFQLCLKIGRVTQISLLSNGKFRQLTDIRRRPNSQGRLAENYEAAGPCQPPHSFSPFELQWSINQLWHPTFLRSARNRKSLKLDSNNRSSHREHRLRHLSHTSCASALAAVPDLCRTP